MRPCSAACSSRHWSSTCGAGASSNTPTDQSQRLVLAAKEELMAVRENLHKSLDQKLAGVDPARAGAPQARAAAAGARQGARASASRRVSRRQRASSRWPVLRAQDAKRGADQPDRERSARRGGRAGPQHHRAGQEERRPRSQEDHRHRDPAHRRRAHRRVDASQPSSLPSRRDEGPHHRPRGPQHPRLRGGDRRRRHHRRHARHGGRLRASSRCAARSARLALERLIADGRIHPGRIEEIVKKAQGRRRARASSRRASRPRTTSAFAACTPELVKLVGRMQYRTSYGQNILEHSKEVALARRHDGRRAGARRRTWPSAARCCTTSARCSPTSTTGTHVQLGVEMATQVRRASGRDQLHRGAPRRRPARIADQRDRAGGRRDLRLAARRAARGVRDVRQAARRSSRRSPSEFKGVEKVFAIQAGREVRVVVTPETVDDPARRAADRTRSRARSSASCSTPDRSGWS